MICQAGHLDFGRVVNNMSKWVVYIVRCSDGSLYTGITNNLDSRIESHNSGKGAKYTRSRLPVELVWFERKRNESYAKKREAAIKKLSRTEKERLVANGLQL